jgi:hypothetical protein
MFKLLSCLATLVLLRAGPQDLPAGRPVLLTCMALYIVVTSFSLSASQASGNILAVLSIAVTLPLLLCWIVLKLANRLARWEQTVSALFGTSALLSLLTLPVSLMAGNEPTPPAALFLLAAFFWSFAVDAHIWRHALTVSFSTGLALAVVLFAVSLFVINTLAGPL